ncbi:HNH endonuclease [Aliarcobacter butzleri]|uniref:HNH endonuclease n=1 Tax=Aliarcobacter butzleri TaxID=28197 RepID=UPI0012F7B1CD|nr:HNH endonuclease [Aliarcobacter butzleri]
MISLNMIKCVYCTNEFIEGKGSFEHVVLSSLGGRKGSRNICCEECNSRLGTEIDKTVADTFSLYSNMLGIRTGRNKEAAVIKNIVKIGDSSYDMLPQGKFELSKNDVKVQDIDKHKKILINAKNEDEAKKILKNIMSNQLKIDPKSVKHLAATVSKTYPPIIQSEIKFGGEEQYRSYAKTILTYLSTVVNPERLRENNFKDIIDYINGVAHKNKYPVLYNGALSLPLHPKISNISHRVFIHASNTKNKVIGILEIFGSIKVSCILSNEWKYEDISKVYVIDPVTSQALNEDISLSDSLINECINMKMMLDDSSINYLKKDFSKLMQEIVSRQHDSRINEHINIAMEKFLHKEGEFITEESIFKLSNYLANEFVNDLYRINSKEDYELKLEDL